MKAGKLRTRVTFQELTETDDGYGGKSEAWTNDKTVSCEFVSQSGKEALESGRLEATNLATLKVRAKSVSGVTPSWRAVIAGEEWNIRQVMPFGQRDRRTDIIIERGVAV